MASPGTALAEHFAGLTQAPLQQKIGYLITLAALIAVLGGMWMWSKAPDYRVLYAGLSDRDGGAVVAFFEWNSRHCISCNSLVFTVNC